MEEDGQRAAFALYCDNGCQREIGPYLLERQRLHKPAALHEQLTCAAARGAEAKASSYLSWNWGQAANGAPGLGIVLAAAQTLAFSSLFPSHS